MEGSWLSTLQVRPGFIRLSDGSQLVLKIFIIDVKEAGFSPFGGVNFDVKVVGGISTLSVPEELKKTVSNKNLMPPEPPRDGWEMVDIIEQKPAEAEEVVTSSQGKFVVKVTAEAIMVARNLGYRSTLGEPIYWVSWVYKFSWKPLKESEVS
jgi:hypothetical protein